MCETLTHTHKHKWHTKSNGFEFKNKYCALKKLFWNTYNVLDARLVSSCFSWPSNARPHLSLLLANNGVSSNTLDKVKPGPTVHPSLLKDDLLLVACFLSKFLYFGFRCFIYFLGFFNEFKYLCLWRICLEENFLFYHQLN